MKSRLIENEKVLLEGGFIIQIRIRALPRSTPERPHGLKYSLVFGRAGERIVGYDNEAGKGDHRHYHDREEPYAFTDIRQMIRDFWEDMRKEVENG